MERLPFAAVVAALAIGGAAQAAEQIASPVVFGNHFQERAECVVMNAGTKPVPVTVKIVDDTVDALHQRAELRRTERPAP